MNYARSLLLILSIFLCSACAPKSFFGELYNQSLNNSLGDTLFPVELPEIKNKGSVVTPNPPYKYDLRPGESIAERNARRRADLDRANWIRAHGEEKPSRDLYDWD